MSFFKTNDGIKLYYQLDGPFDGPMVMLLGGYTSNTATWLPQVQALNQAGYRTLRMDYRSHGQSERTPQGLRIARLAQDVHELIDHLNIEEMDVIGHSMGVSVLEIYLSLFGNDKIKKIITEDQSPKMLNDDNWQDGLRESSMDQLAVFAERFPRIKLTQKHLSTSVKQALAEHYTSFDFKLTRPLLLDGIAQDWRDVLPLEQRPHLFLSGDASPLYPATYPETALRLQGDVRSKAYHFANVGHVPHLEAVEEFNQEMLKFLAEL